MDLSAFSSASEDGATLHLKGPDGALLHQDDGSPITIKLAGNDSKRWRGCMDRVGDSRLKKVVPGRPSNYTMAEQRDDACTLLASVTLSWQGIIVDGTPMECTAENAKKLYQRFNWIREQVDEFVGERRNFSPASLTT